MKFKVRTATGQEIEIDAAEIARAHAAMTAGGPAPAPAPAPAALPGTGELASSFVALRDTVTALQTTLTEERTERQRERAATAVDLLITGGRVPPANREHWMRVYLSDRPTFDALAATLPVRTRLAGAGGEGGRQPGDYVPPAEFGTGAGGEGDPEGEGAGAGAGGGGLNLRAGETTRHDGNVPNVGADARWMREIDRLKREQNLSDRQAGEVLQLREPQLWHARREELAGMRIPRSDARNNRHLTAVS